MPSDVRCSNHGNIMRAARRLTGIRPPKGRVTPAGCRRVLVAFAPVFAAFCMIMTPKAFPAKAALVIANPKSKLLDQLREVLRVKHYSLRTEEAYGQWVRRFLKFHRDQAGAWRHPRELGTAEVVAFLNHLAITDSAAAGTQNQALNAISFLYTQVLRIELGDLGEFLRAGKRRLADQHRQHRPAQQQWNRHCRWDANHNRR